MEGQGEGRHVTGPDPKERYLRSHRGGGVSGFHVVCGLFALVALVLDFFFGAMAPHLTPTELDPIHSLEAAGRDPAGIHQALSAQRARKKIVAPHITNARKALKGNTYKRGRKETRGRRVKYSKKMVLRMDTARKDLVDESFEWQGSALARYPQGGSRTRRPPQHSQERFRA